ncbi:MAG: bifunctional tetrahydrofolate synthase/dihydrofolate synthase [Piscirickettsiaceae bacterium]|nr:bifunctional tetrahydrofolate synthase/dihydrofolate synthase [Piscirickettsiaceae bacterium]
MRFQNLPQWLRWQENLHFTDVDPGLERVGQVWQQLREKSHLPFTVITVAGTNGKGSSVAMLESILRAAGYRTGTYTSPHLLRYNERICVDGAPCSDQLICDAFDRIDQARAEISLTYFEFATLAAVDIFCEKNIDIAILEVGMGGRLDAVNLFDADIALITPISLDHTAWLGTNREQIAYEKAGIIRAGKPVVCSESTPATSLLEHAQSLQAPVYMAEEAFHISKENECWNWSSERVRWHNLPYPALVGSYQVQNAAAVLQVIALLIKQDYTVSQESIESGLKSVQLAGRFQQVKGDVELIYDVTHNQQGAENLANLLQENTCEGKTIAVLGMLKDKNVTSVVTALKDNVDIWYVAGLETDRGMTVEDLALQLSAILDADKIKKYDTIHLAYKQAKNNTLAGDRILIFGSFLTVQSITMLNQLNK